MYWLGAELLLVHLVAMDLDANAISVATSGSTPSGGVARPPVMNEVRLVTKGPVSLLPGTLSPVNWKDSRSGREREWVS